MPITTGHSAPLFCTPVLYSPWHSDLLWRLANLKWDLPLIIPALCKWVCAYDCPVWLAAKCACLCVCFQLHLLPLSRIFYQSGAGAVDHSPLSVPDSLENVAEAHTSGSFLSSLSILTLHQMQHFSSWLFSIRIALTWSKWMQFNGTNNVNLPSCLTQTRFSTIGSAIAISQYHQCTIWKIMIM